MGSLLEDDGALGRAVETAFFKHVFTRYYNVGIGFSYWRGRKNEEVDIVAQVGGRTIPFEVKYRMQKTGLDELKGIVKFCNEKQIDQGYVITREMADFGVLPFGSRQLLKIPAALACFWLGQSEVLGTKQTEADLES
jgi:predicted AAA+ superfamily ATPase